MNKSSLKPLIAVLLTLIVLSMPAVSLAQTVFDSAQPDLPLYNGGGNTVSWPQAEYSWGPPYFPLGAACSTTNVTNSDQQVGGGPYDAIVLLPFQTSPVGFGVPGSGWGYYTTWITARGDGTCILMTMHAHRPMPNAPNPIAVKPGQTDKAGDPVDLSTGLFVLNKTDLVLPDVLPIALTRTYRTLDTASHAFGIGATHSYDLSLRLIGQCREVDLVLPDGGRVKYSRISGTTCYDARLSHTPTPTRFYQSTLTFDSSTRRWRLTLKDGTTYRFTAAGLAPVYASTTVPATRFTLSDPLLAEIQDRYGNVLTVARDVNLRPTQITSPNSRSIQFSYGDPMDSGRVTQAQDNTGRIVGYQYDGLGRLSKVTDPENGVTEYTYDLTHRMQTIKDARGITFLTNTYEPSSGRVIDQVLADGTYHFAYTTDVNGSVTQTDVTDPRGFIRRVIFNSAGYTVSDTHALGQPEAQTTTYELHADSNLMVSVTDPLGRKTAYSYDTMGNATTVTRLAGAQAVTTTMTYESIFQQVKTVTDPLLHTTTMGYDAEGKLLSLTNALGKTWTVTSDASGRPISITNPAPISSTTTLSYTGADLTSTTDPLNRVTTRVADAAGRLLKLTNALGAQTTYDYDKLNRLTRIMDSENGSTRFAYDSNGNLTALTDAISHATGYVYDTMDRVQSRTDPMAKPEEYGYDHSGNLTSVKDRKGQITTVTYDPVDRRKLVTYADASTTTFTWDNGNRLRQVVDSVSGTITLSYDDLDRLTSETTPQGAVIYSYDAVGRRTRMTVPGQVDVLYTYDDANQLRTITQGTALIMFDYDEAGRRVRLTLPAGLTVAYGYDGASQLVSLTYQKNLAVLGTLTYSYDGAGNRSTVGGSWAQTALPDPVTTATYDAGNRQKTFNAVTLNSDADGQLTTASEAGSTVTYTWDARHRLTGVSTTGGLRATIAYDALGRRISKTINGVATTYLYDGLNAVQEKAGASVTANLLTGLGIDEVFTRTDAGGRRTFLTDALGSPVNLMDDTGTQQTTYIYEPFGNTIQGGDPSTNSFQYTGRENDGTGLFYYRARYYNPRLQRFISEDPIGFAGGDVNLYAYVLNSPTRFVDPLGLDWFRPPSDDYIVGRDDTLVRPGKDIGKFLDDYVPAMHTLGEFHDALVDMGLELGLPDWLINIPTMPGVYIIAVEAELHNSLNKMRNKMRDKMRDRDGGLGKRK